MKKISSGIILVSMLMSGCASIKLDPQANRIIASPNPAPKGCRYVGQVVGNQGNFFTGDWTSNKNLEEGAMNDLKNKASRLGANYIQLITNRAGNTGSISGFDGNVSGHMSQTNVTNLGNAYLCPEKAIGL
ncbi:DUF4156 domain-containing protein [Legionella brunensis]|uniref:Cytochrome c type biogenesis protein CycH n=1 Tax=Legionella brunensis TaxID=29422 RepID=A0A0W0S0G0_9GAMM|nr:DUF4156 domain-containing protein [Legionella brunensis]KTC76999.1 cytochrome c type biogenesis protein CycH [Legionella brunensis]